MAEGLPLLSSIVQTKETVVRMWQNEMLLASKPGSSPTLPSHLWYMCQVAGQEEKVKCAAAAVPLFHFSASCSGNHTDVNQPSSALVGRAKSEQPTKCNTGSTRRNKTYENGTLKLHHNAKDGPQTLIVQACMTTALLLLRTEQTVIAKSVILIPCSTRIAPFFHLCERRTHTMKRK